MDVESPRLKGLVGNLRTQDPTRKVRLVRIIFARWLREHPDAVAGKAQAKGMNEARRAKRLAADVAAAPEATSKRKAPHPFDADMEQRIGLAASTVEKLRAKGRAIPNAALKHVGSRGDLKRVNSLLDRMEYVLRNDPSADWRVMMDNHLHPLPPPAKGTLVLEFPLTFMRHDSMGQLREMVRKRAKVDAVICDPPYGVNHTGLVNGPMTDDEKGSLWFVPLAAKLIKPGRPVCIWCSGATLGNWTRAVLDTGMVISALVHWDKLSPWQSARGEEVMLVAGHGLIDVPEALRVIKEPTLAKNHEARTAHDTAKPVALFEPIISALTKPGDTILDPFAGTAPIGVAALRAGRRYVGAELDVKVADYAVTKLRDVLRHEAWRVAA